MTNPYAYNKPPLDELEQRRLEMLQELETYRWKFLMDDIKNYLYGAILMVILLMLTLTFKVEITLRNLSYIYMGLLALCLVVDICAVWRYRLRKK